MGSVAKNLAFLIIVNIFTVAITRSYFVSAAPTDEEAPKQPVFANNYSVRGFLKLPYAELDEPFLAWYDKDLGRSRTDYYGDLYKVYQFGPKSVPDQSSSKFGAIYKLVYVPANFETKSASNESSLINRVRSVLTGLEHDLGFGGRGQQAVGGKTPTRRTCFAVNGGVGFTVGPQTVLPDLSDFSFDTVDKCPLGNEVHRHSKCEVWKLVTNVGDKKNIYKMFVKRDKSTGEAIPVYYYMLGYDSLLGSHFDRYDIVYFDYKPRGARDVDFTFDTRAQSCGPMPGPGDDSTDQELRSYSIIQNPIHEYVSSPHRYDHVDHQFEEFKHDHSKSYKDEEQHRRGWHRFLHNLRFINGKNRELKHYKLKVNKFADSSPAELHYLRGRIMSKNREEGVNYAIHHGLRGSSGRSTNRSLYSNLPETWDWTIRGAVTPVKDQAVCGSCWSFGTSGTIEGAYFVKTGKLMRLSQQQMIDCSWAYSNNGCDGGEDFRAYKYIQDAGGLATEEDYGDYIGVDGKCHDKDVKKSVKIKGFFEITHEDSEALQHAILNYGPATVAIDASRPTFTFYSHGLYYDDKCNKSPDGLDHQVLVTGYTHVDGKLAWIVKNSWSTYWGNNGYILMSAENNNCGVMDVPTVPIIDS